MTDTVIIIAFFLMGLSIGLTFGYLFGLSRKYDMHISKLKEFEGFCDTKIAELQAKMNELPEVTVRRRPDA